MKNLGREGLDCHLYYLRRALVVTETKGADVSHPCPSSDAGDHKFVGLENGLSIPVNWGAGRFSQKTRQKGGKLPGTTENCFWEKMVEKGGEARAGYGGGSGKLLYKWGFTVR